MESENRTGIQMASKMASETYKTGKKLPKPNFLSAIQIVRVFKNWKLNCQFFTRFRYTGINNLDPDHLGIRMFLLFGSPI